jgi:sporulation protein YlmC with PRC-barrel domain
MRILAIMTASALAFAAPAMAQTAPSGSAGQAPAHSPGLGSAPSAPAAQQKPAVNPLTTDDVSQLNGTNVYGGNGGKVGSISTALMNPESKKIDRLVISAGGVLGIGAHHVALPISQFNWQSDKGGFQIAQTEEQLKTMPEWNGSDASSSRAEPGGTTTSSAAPVEPNAPQRH